jgi:hypothetical protein
MDEPSTILEPEGIFRPRKQAASRAVLWLIGGIVALGSAALGFLVACIGRVNPLSLQFMATVPTLLGIGCIWRAWTGLHGPREVGIGPNGVRIDTGRQSRTYGWDQIGWSSNQMAGLSYQRYLRLYDAKGRRIADLSEVLEDFDSLAELIRQHIAAKGDATAGRIQSAKAMRTAALAVVMGVVIMAGCAWLAWDTRSKILDAQLLDHAAVLGQAEIEERFLAPNGVTPRLVYRITTPDGRSATHNAEVERPIWNALKNANTVPVWYVPDDPGNTCLMVGEVKDRDFQEPIIGYGLPAVGAVFSLFLLGAGTFMFCGWTIDMDSKTGRFSIKRLGTGK